MGLTHYKTLAGSLPPWELARAVARRANRIARVRLYRRREPLSCEALAALRGETPAAFVERVLGGGVGGPFEPRRREALSEALETLPGVLEAILTRAERILTEGPTAFGHRCARRLDGGIDWDVDPASGHGYPRAAHDTLRLLSPPADPKRPWDLGRLDGAVALAQGAWVGKTEQERSRFATAFCELALDFVAWCPEGQGIQWTCPMEVALRGMNLAIGVRMLSDRPELRAEPRTGALLAALEAHGRFVEANLEDAGAVPNNHLVANVVGLLGMAVLLPELPGASRWSRLARSCLPQLMREQVHPEGTSFEGSIPYHRLAVELFTMGAVFAEHGGLKLGDAYRERLRRMFEVAESYCGLAGRAPQLGDNDSGRAIPFTERASLSHGYLAPLGAVLFADGSLKRPVDRLPEEALWLVPDATARWERLEARAERGSRLWELGGWALLRAGGLELCASVGANGQRGVGGHSHNDKLSFELQLDGVPLLVDRGTYTYLGDPERRERFRSTAAHNTVEVDGHEQSPLDPTRPFALPDTARVRIERWNPDADGGAVLEASHDGYRRLELPVLHRRRFELEGEARALRIDDAIDLEAEGGLPVISRLHFVDREARLRPVEAAELARVRALAPESADVHPMAVEVGSPDAPRAVVLFSRAYEPELVEAEHSEGYGELSSALTLELRATAPATLRTWVLGSTRG